MYYVPNQKHWVFFRIFAWRICKHLHGTYSVLFFSLYSVAIKKNRTWQKWQERHSFPHLLVLALQYVKYQCLKCLHSVGKKFQILNGILAHSSFSRPFHSTYHFVQKIGIRLTGWCYGAKRKTPQNSLMIFSNCSLNKYLDLRKEGRLLMGKIA